MRLHRMLIAALLVFAACRPADSDIAIVNIWARPAQASTGSAVYLSIENKSRVADRLISVTTDLTDTVYLHETHIENNVAHMQRINQVDIPANGSVEFKPGGYHVMLMSLRRALVTGDTVALTFKFQSGKNITIDAVIQDEAP